MVIVFENQTFTEPIMVNETGEYVVRNCTFEVGVPAPDSSHLGLENTVRDIFDIFDVYWDDDKADRIRTLL